MLCSIIWQLSYFNKWKKLSIGIDFGIGIDQNSWYRTGIVSKPKKLVSPITRIWEWETRVACGGGYVPFSYPEPFLRAVQRGALAKSITGYHKNMLLELANQMPVRNMDLARAPRRTARKQGSGYENGYVQSRTKIFIGQLARFGSRPLYYIYLKFLKFGPLMEAPRLLSVC